MTDKRLQSQKPFTDLAKKLLWLDEAANVSILIKGLIVLCILLVVADFIIHRHAYFQFERWYGFYAISGFVAFTCIVLSAKLLRRVIGRDESYYGSHAVDSESYPPTGLHKRSHDGSDADGDHGA